MNQNVQKTVVIFTVCSFVIISRSLGRRICTGHAILSDALDLADFDFRTPLPTNLRKRPVVSPSWAWRLSSKTPEINQALSNAYLKSQGLYELRDGWIKLHHS